MCVVTPTSPTRLGIPVTIPRAKKTSACDSIARLFLMFWMRQPRTSDDLRSSLSARISYKLIS